MDKLLLKGIYNIICNYKQKFSNQDINLLTSLCSIFNAKLNDDEIEEWITINGAHIPILKGQSKEEAITAFIDSHTGGGYSDNNESNRAQIARAEGKVTAKELAKALNIKMEDAKELYSPEWHHTGKSFKQTPFYPIEAYLDLQKKGKISKKNVEKYDLTPLEIKLITDSYNKLIARGKTQKMEDLLQPFIEKYKNDKNLQEIFDEVLNKHKKNVGFAAAEIRRAIHYVQDFGHDYSNEDLKERLKRLGENIDFYSTKSMELRQKK